MQARYKKYILDFKRPSGTSRGILRQKETWFLVLEDKGRYGLGECGLLKGLSVDDVPEYESKLQWTCNHIHLGKDELWNALIDFPSIQFGVEQAFLSINAVHPFDFFPSDFSKNEKPIHINGLIWMGEEAFMHDQITEKLATGFNCIKMKIGAIDFDTEIALLASIRKKYTPDEIALRVDANGAFKPAEALKKLQVLADFRLHSIEQPIKQGNPLLMKALCAESPLPIALDEELIGVSGVTEKENLLQTIQPQFIILKPSLVGGYKGSLEWIRIADKLGVGWWVTSALESNIGLNAIARWTYTLGNSMPQGLGTGGLYTNNFESPLSVEAGKLYSRKNKEWASDLIQEICT